MRAQFWLHFLGACTLGTAQNGPRPQGINSTSDAERARFNAARTLSVGYVVYPGFTMLDVFGPLEILAQLSWPYKMSFSVIAQSTGPISSLPPPHFGMDMGFMIGASVVATHTFLNAPALDVLIVPGGIGAVPLREQNNTEIEKFIQNRYDQVEILASVCTGSEFLARSGVLAGKKATTNKSAWASVTSVGKNITWVPSARWVQDGKIWTSSGVTAGIDMTYALVKHLYGTQELDPMMNLLEYAPHTDPHWDPFAVVHNVPGADKSRPLTDCIGPVGVKTAKRAVRRH